MSQEVKYSIIAGMIVVFLAGFLLPVWASVLTGFATMFAVAGYHDWKKKNR